MTEAAPTRPPSIHHNGPGSLTSSTSSSTALDEVRSLLKLDLVSLDDQISLLDSMTPSAQRHLVSRISTLDASLLMTFKNQVKLVDTVLRKIVTPDGEMRHGAEDYDLSLKHALDMSLKVTQIMVRELPKLYTLERIQRQEEALRMVMEAHLSPEQQDALLEELEKLEGSS